MTQRVQHVTLGTTAYTQVQAITRLTEMLGPCPDGYRVILTYFDFMTANYKEIAVKYNLALETFILA